MKDLEGHDGTARPESQGSAKSRLCPVAYEQEHNVVCIGHNAEGYRRDMRSFPLFQGSRPGLFYNLSTGESCPLRIPFDRLRAAASPIDPP